MNIRGHPVSSLEEVYREYIPYTREPYYFPCNDVIYEVKYDDMANKIIYIYKLQGQVKSLEDRVKELEERLAKYESHTESNDGISECPVYTESISSTGDELSTGKDAGTVT